VWVAGPAARERYALADVGIDDRDVVEGSGAPAASFVLPGRPRGVPSTTATPGRAAERPVPGSRGSLPCAFANRP
ncbi:hypothetical protein ACWD6T_30610, partial [Streptomyces albidoflavus]